MTLRIEKLGLTPYGIAHERQIGLLNTLRDNKSKQDICLVLQHPSVFTIGRNGTDSNVTVSQEFLKKHALALLKVERGGEITFHGPGQIVCYPIINLRRINLRVTEFVHTLEQVMLKVVSRFGLTAGLNERNHGIWFNNRKLGSIGIAVRHGISYHGLALNVNPDLEPFTWINPCGLSDISMTSMERELQRTLNYTEIESAMIEEMKNAFYRPKEKKSLRVGKPHWLKQRLPKGSGYEKTRNIVRSSGLCTVCQEARCPNQFECFGKGTATFMLMGENCTRNCTFCAISGAETQVLDAEEPSRISKAVDKMNLKYVVLTSVTRDDLPDGGANHFAKTLDAIRGRCSDTLTEILIPDFQGDKTALECVCRHHPSVLNHNVETVVNLYPTVRPQAIYERSLELLRRVKSINPDIITKSGIMVGLGETKEELVQTMADIRATGCDLLTLGQYLQPTPDNLPVKRYVPPAEFEIFKNTALDLGFAGVASGPHVRSSYQAGELYSKAVSIQKRYH